jgi:NhaP-type Na+/H+ or K+/H+ antiporter
VLGAITGWITCRMTPPIDEYSLEIMISLALAAGSYLLAMLFLVLGAEIVALRFRGAVAVAALSAIPLSLIVGAISVVAPHVANPRIWAGAMVLTWSGLRGGISVALALSLPATPWRQDLLFICSVIVVFTVLVQGLTIERVIALAFHRHRAARAAADRDRRARP